MKNKLVVINVLGAPGTGKSTIASGLFHEMKMKHYSVELVTEYAKDLVWEKRHKTLVDQLYITAKQNHRIQRLVGEVEFVITDSPILLGLMYAPNGYYTKFHPLVWEVFNSYANINVFLNRVKPYVEKGRNQTEAESDAVSLEIEDMLTDNNIKFTKFDADEKAIGKIIKEVEKIDSRYLK